VYKPPVLSVWLDGSERPVLEAPVDFSVVTDPQGKAWVGLTASTGGGYENHDVLNWTFNGENISTKMSVISTEITFLMTDCLPGRNLCTPEHATVEPKGDGFHIILPANAEWGASIPNPQQRPVAIENEHGLACWQPKGCGGPENAIEIKNADGRTWFQVSGTPGAFAKNEGFFDFDVQLK
jgi:hypothetical protein